MSDTRYWSKEFTLQFIELYKQYPCLWKIKSKDYINKNLKREAYDELTKFCKTTIPEANKDFVIKKIQSFRGSFRKELKKVVDSKRSGASLDDVYVPTLWYYDHLVFTIDQELPTESICNLMNTVNSVENDDDEASQQVLESDNIEILDKVNKKNHIF
ncbi:unnamed protein product [Macrosiphum euphorbiae]|uniref:MADF domain-containing protein n=1 Tax=Macrosiphum euphorbiae TaxID=13131 RepID=A0AAV0XZU3_9HEMI|nr:unnamed protein product [Macrosiphum euphorbiae]